MKMKKVLFILGFILILGIGFGINKNEEKKVIDYYITKAHNPKVVSFLKEIKNNNNSEVVGNLMLTNDSLYILSDNGRYKKVSSSYISYGNEDYVIESLNTYANRGTLGKEI